MAYDQNNIFAKILTGEIPCDKVYEDKHVLAFKDAFPQTAVHILVIPKGAYTDFDDFTAHASDAEILAWTKAAGHVARSAGIDKEGYRIIANCRNNSGQEVPHLHLHIVGGEKLGVMLSKL